MTRPRADGQLRVRKLRLPPKAVLDRQQVVIGAVPEVRRLAYGRQVNYRERTLRRKIGAVLRHRSGVTDGDQAFPCREVGDDSS